MATLHNFRSVCANGLLFRDGSTCTACVNGNTLPALRHGCYRGSRPASIPLAIHNAGGLSRSRLLGRADRVIVLSERSRQILSGAGPADLTRKMVVLPSGLADRALSGAQRAHALVVRREAQPREGNSRVDQIVARKRATCGCR